MDREPARSSHAAQERYIRIISEPLKCISKAIWFTSPTLRGDDEDRTLQLAGRDPTRLHREGRPPVFLTATQQYRLVPDERFAPGEWKASTRAYIYTVWDECDHRLSEAIAWHWHPGSGTSDEPHMHVYCGGSIGGDLLKGLHLPSERVAFEHVVRFVITELGVTPRRGDWETLVSVALGRFVQFRTWPVSGSPPPASN